MLFSYFKFGLTKRTVNNSGIFGCVLILYSTLVMVIFPTQQTYSIPGAEPIQIKLQSVFSNLSFVSCMVIKLWKLAASIFEKIVGYGTW